MEGTNPLQRMILEEYAESIKAHKGRKQIIKEIAERHRLTMGIIEGLIELGATAGLKRSEAQFRTPDSACVRTSSKWEPIDYVEVIEDLRVRVENLERRFGHILDGIGRVIEDGEIMGAHLQNLRKMGRWLKGSGTIETESRPRLIHNGNGREKITG